MNRKLIFFLLATFLAVKSHPSPLWAEEQGITFLSPWEEHCLSEGLRALGLTRRDLSLPSDYIQDPFRLPIINTLMREPLMMPHFAEDLRTDMLEAEQSLPELIAASSSALGLEVGPYPPTLSQARDRQALIETIKALGFSAPLSPSQLKTLEDEVASLPDEAVGPLCLLLEGVSRAFQAVREAFKDLNEQEVLFLKSHMPALLTYAEEGIETEVYERYKKAQEEKEIRDRCLSLAQKVDERKFLLAAYHLSHAMDEALKSLKARPPLLPKSLLISTPLGKVVLGSSQQDIYASSESYVLIIDAQGDDLYIGKGLATSGPEKPLCIIIDLEGDDLYRVHEPFALGGAFMGLSLLVDEEGKDSYQCGNYGLGSGLLGVGLIKDAQGNDSYLSDTCSQGSGFFGLGLLLDRDGHDSYEAFLLSQGMGSTEGFGALVDLGGNDSYLAGGAYLDVLRYEEHHESLSQGFGYGLRPVASGGIGLLLDAKGNDSYKADIFGQGSSYWFSLGLLLDLEGNDTYLAHQYVQGAATHLCLGLLWDIQGDDQYSAFTIAQGCGHDYATGMLMDSEGDDSYLLKGFGLGAGNANGFGLCLELKGKDTYLLAPEAQALGADRPARDFPSIGIMVDSSGEDLYSVTGKDDSFWTQGFYGIGGDLHGSKGGNPFLCVKERGFPPLTPFPKETISEETGSRIQESDRLISKSLSPVTCYLLPKIERLFAQATSAFLEDRPDVGKAREQIASLGQEALPFLLSKVSSNDVAEQNALLDIFEQMGPEIAKPLLKAFKKETTEEGQALLSMALGKIKVQRALKPLQKAMASPSWRVRSACAWALGQLGDKKALESLLKVVEDPHPLVRTRVACALGQLKEKKAMPTLLKAMMEDDYYGVRVCASQGLIALGKEALPSLREAFLHEARAERKVMVLWCLGQIGDPESMAVVTPFLEEDDFALRASACQALGHLQNPQAQPALKALLEKEEHPFVRLRLKEAFKNLE